MTVRGPVLFETRCVLLDDVLVEAHFTIAFLPRDAIRKHGLCCRPVSVRPSIRLSVCLSRPCILSRRLKLSSNFFLGPVAPSF